MLFTTNHILCSISGYAFLKYHHIITGYLLLILNRYCIIHLKNEKRLSKDHSKITKLIKLFIHIINY